MDLIASRETKDVLNFAIQVNSYQGGVIAKKKETARILSNSSQVLTLTLSPDLTVNSSK